MCLSLYIATDAPIPAGAFGRLSVENVESNVLEQLRNVFSKPSIR